MNDYLKKKKDERIIKLMSNFKIIDTYNHIKTNLKEQIAIIMYHRICSKKDIWSIDTLDTNELEKQIKYLKKYYEILSLEKLHELLSLNKKLPKKGVVITFDDGYKDNFTNAYPILKKYNIPATIFLTTGYIGKDELFWWDKVGYILCNTKLKNINLEDYGNISSPPKENITSYLDSVIENLKYMKEEKREEIIQLLLKNSGVEIPKEISIDITASWNDIKEMHENNISFGAHTVNHKVLSKIPINEAKFEILQSKNDIEKNLKTSIKTFSYPYGQVNDFNDEIINILKESGFDCAVTGIPGMVSKNSDLFKLDRVWCGWSFETFMFFISGLYAEKKLGRIIKN